MNRTIFLIASLLLFMFACKSSSTDADTEENKALAIYGASCGFSLEASGGFSGNSEGPASFEWDGNDTELSIELHGFTAEGAKGDGLEAGVTVQAWDGGTGEYSIFSAGIGHHTRTEPPTTGIYFSNDDGLACDSCGGSVTIEQVSEESISGTFEVTMATLDENSPPVTATATFIAALQTSQVFDAYNDCSQEWADN